MQNISYSKIKQPIPTLTTDTNTSQQLQLQIQTQIDQSTDHRHQQGLTSKSRSRPRSRSKRNKNRDQRNEGQINDGIRGRRGIIEQEDGSKKIRRISYCIIIALIAGICWLMFFADRDHYHGQNSQQFVQDKDDKDDKSIHDTNNDNTNAQIKKQQPSIITSQTQSLQSKPKLFKHKYLTNPQLTPKISQILQNTFYDAHYFLQDRQNCNHQNPLIYQLSNFTYIQQQQQSQNKRNNLIKLTKTPQQYQQLIQKMKNNKEKPQNFPQISAVKRVTNQSINLAYFYYSLYQQPQNQQFLQTQYYRYDKLYKIGQFNKQLPLCVTLIGKNTAKYHQRLYKGIQRQNYSNYRIVHIDDNSNDGTQQKMVQMLRSNISQQFRNKITFISNQIRRNQLYNRNSAIIDYCPLDSIIIDMDADDWIIGNQVFQLVNTLYQQGQQYKQQKYDTWALYFAPIVYQSHCPCILPNVDGQIPQSSFTDKTYRTAGRWRTTHLRTFLRSIYLKIDKSDFIDKQNPHYLYPQSPDSFMHNAILQLSGIKHLRVLDQFLYYYSTTLQNNRRRDASVDIAYSAYNSQALTPYQTLEDINWQVKRVKGYILPDKARENRDEKIREVREIRSKIQSQFEGIIEEYQNSNKQKKNKL